MLTDDMPANRVLIVEDNSASAKAIAKLFELSGASTLVCLDPYDAVEAALRPDITLVSLDLSMPHLNGHETLSLIRSHEQSRSIPSIPVMTITGWATAQDRAKSLSEGFVAHLTKPVALEEVQVALARASRLKSTLYLSRFSVDTADIVAGLTLMSGTTRSRARDALIALVSAFESRGVDYIYEMALGLFANRRVQATNAALHLADLALTVRATKLRELTAQFADSIDTPPMGLEELILRVRSELQRVVFTIREEVIGRLPSDEH